VSARVQGVTGWRKLARPDRPLEAPQRPLDGRVLVGNPRAPFVGGTPPLAPLSEASRGLSEDFPWSEVDCIRWLRLGSVLETLICKSKPRSISRTRSELLQVCGVYNAHNLALHRLELTHIGGFRVSATRARENARTRARASTRTRVGPRADTRTRALTRVAPGRVRGVIHNRGDR
jgi:hypothetical protein